MKWGGTCERFRLSEASAEHLHLYFPSKLEKGNIFSPICSGQVNDKATTQNHVVILLRKVPRIQEHTDNKPQVQVHLL